MKQNITRQSGFTKTNIKSKRRRRLKYRLRRFLVFLIFASFLAATGWGGYHAFRWGSSVFAEYYAMYQSYLARRDDLKSIIATEVDNYMNVVFLGLDEGSAGIAPQVDSIMLVSLDRGKGKLRAVSIPRGTLFPGDGGRTDTANALYQKGGAIETVRAIRDLLGVNVHYYAALDPRVLTELVDALDGIDIYVESRMDYDDPEVGLAIHLSQGYQHMDGDTAQKFLRYRSGDLGDIGRVQRQHRFVKAMYEKLLQVDTVPRLPQLAKVMQERVQTNAEIWDGSTLADTVKALSPGMPEVIMLPGKTRPDNDMVFIPDKARIQEKMQQFFPPPESETAAEKK